MDTVVNRVMKVQADAYKIVTTARKPSDNVRVLAVAKALPKHRMIVLAMGELGFPTRVLSPVFGGVYHLCRAHVRRRHRRRPGERALPAASLPRGKTPQVRQDLRRDRRSGAPLHIARGPQSRLSIAARGCGLSAVPGLAGVPARFLLAGRQAAARRLQRHHPAQAEDHPLPGYGGSAGAPHRRGQHRLAQGRQVARHQYRRRRRHRPALPPAASSPTPPC